VGRSNEIVKSGAKKVVPREIENALYSLDGVIEAAAIGIPDPILGTAIKAFVVAAKEYKESITSEAVMAHCKRTLETYKVPQVIEVRESLPKTSNGKILKAQLK
jgi:long-chain acyl-CoA synthetase